MPTAPMNGDDDRPVTRGELKAELAAFPTRDEMRLEIATAMSYVVDTLGGRMDQMRTEMAAMRTDMAATRDELRTELRSDMAAMRDELRTDMAAMRDDLSRELARHVTASAEETQRLIIGLDDRYRDLPARVTVVERDLDEHRRDTGLHPPRRRR